MWFRLLLVASLSVAFVNAVARADAPPRAPRATLVEVLRGGKQVLVLDRTTSDYAVMKVGDSIQGFRISAIEDDQMILVGSGKPQRTFIIPLLDRSPMPPMKKAPLAGSSGELADPYTSPAPQGASAAPAPAAGAPTGDGAADGDGAVMDPYGPSEIPSVMAPPTSRAGAPDAAPAPAPAAPTSTPPVAPAPTPAPASSAPATAPAPAAAPPSAPALPAEPGATPAPAGAKTAGKAAAARTEKRRLSRKELNRALSDFAALTREIKIERASGGGVVVTDLAKGSFAARAGIVKGDVVRRVAGHSIDTVDDAAGAYAAVVASKQVVVEIERRGARLHITYQLTD